MKEITQAFGDITVGQVVLVLAGLLALWEAGKKVYEWIADKIRHNDKMQGFFEHKVTEDGEEKKSFITLETINLKLNYIESTIKKLLDYQKHSSGRELRALYHQAKEEYDRYGFVIDETWDDLQSASIDHFAANGNTIAEGDIEEIRELPKGDIKTLLRRKEKENENAKHYL